ncbi:MAG TPA: DegV family protein [Streptosporangiaceae bacterium]|nr:DegV family protein [Streptosporangiaceae bacterium]
MPGRDLDSAGRGLVAVVTDSAACLPADLARAHQVRVVPLRVLVGDLAISDDLAGWPAVLDELLRRGERLTTARPAPAMFAAAYRQAADDGAAAVVSVHVSGRLSGTVSSAASAAADAPVPVRVVDSRSIGMGLGLAVLAAARAAGSGQSAGDVASIAEERAARTGSFFALDSLRALLAGGRLVEARGAASPALVSRPLLAILAGRVTVLERVRTRSAAADRLTELAAEFAAGREVDIAVQHIGAQARAAELADRLAMVITRARHLYLAEAGAAIVTHTGLGMLGVALAPHQASGRGVLAVGAAAEADDLPAPARQRRAN